VCQFDTTHLCGMTQTDASVLQWVHKRGAGPNYPATGPEGDKNGNRGGGYAFVDSLANMVSYFS